MATDRLKDFLSRDPYGSAHGTQTLDYLVDHNGDKKADPYLDDLEKDLKETLGNWVQEYTSENRYSPEKGSSEFSLTDDAGNPSTPTVGSDNATKFSDDVKDDDLLAYFEQISGGGTPDADGGGTFDPNQLRDVVVKDGSDPNKSGHQTLDTAHDKKLISPVLTQHNRWHPRGNSPYIDPGGNAGSTIDSKKYTTYQPKLGEYNPDAKAVALKEMKDVAEKLLITAVGHDPNFAPFLQGLLPSWAQLGTSKLNRSSLEADAAAAGTTAFPASHESSDTFSVNVESTTIRSKSYGVMTSPLEPFSAIPKMGMTTLAIAMILALGIFTDIVIMILGIFLAPIPSGAELANSIGLENPGFLNKGIFAKSAPALVNPAFFGIRHTKIPFKDAAELGAEVFFGEAELNPPAGLLAGLMPGGKNVLDAPGFYGIIFRAVVRSTIDLGIFIGEIFSGGLMAAMSGIMKLFDAIRNSKLIGYMNMLATLGDVYSGVLAQVDTGEVVVTNDPDHYGGVGVTISKLDALKIEEDPKHRVGKNRRGDGLDNRMMWRAGATPSVYLVPPVIAQVYAATKDGALAMTDLGLSDPSYHADYAADYAEFGNAGDDGLSSAVAHKVAYNESGRMSGETVGFIEGLLDAEYMPFYFQDLRTNEIVSFHAFLTSLSDSYTANYESSTGYGRVDPVMIYNNTSRSIGLTFKVVSTDPADFNEMWWKINQLTQMVYPQYSGGTTVKSSDGVIHAAPFSQVISASPLIRMRLGDLFKSNYSKFSLSRIFGFENDSEFDNGSGEYSIDDIAKAVSDITRVIDKRAVGDITAPPLFGAPTVQFCALAPIKISVEKDQDGAISSSLVMIPAGTVLKIKKMNITFEALAMMLKTGNLEDLAAYGIAECEIDDTVVYDGGPAPVTPEADSPLAKVQKRIALYSARIGGENSTIKVPYHQLANGSKFKPYDPAGILTPTTTPATDVLGFMDSENNPITKAFESTRGKGLAGVITQLDFAWLEVPWSTEGDKAPMMCEVTISYQPIHDIPPGKDRHGFNRAPIYNVGEASKTVGGDPYDS